MPFGLPGFIARWLAALFLVFATYNPSGYSYCDWIADLGGGQWVLKALATILLIIAYGTFILATLRSLGVLGVVTWFLFFSSIAWLMINIGVIQTLSARTLVTIGLVIAANVFAVGVSWSYIRLRLSGQADTNNVTIVF
jgi:Family of unknown function (DUF6524)